MASSKLVSVRFFRPSTLLCCAAAVVCLAVGVEAVPQDREATPAASLTRLKQRLDKPTGKALKPSAPVQLRPVFKTRIIDRPFVPTLDEHLRETFSLTDFQRQYAGYAAKCCGLDLGALIGHVDRALDERAARKARAQVSRELAEVEAARPPPVR